MPKQKLYRMDHLAETWRLFSLLTEEQQDRLLAACAAVVADPSLDLKDVLRQMEGQANVRT